jgi:KDO2-lipid IV(A) lauroyltransferase
MPRSFIRGLGSGIGSLGYFAAGRQRKIALESLNIAFGAEKTEDELKKIAKDSFTFMAKSGLEIMHLLDHPGFLRERVEIAGKEILDSALAKGKGVILVSAHFGNFPLILARLCMDGYKGCGIMRLMRDSRVEKIFSKKRQNFRVKTIYSQPRDVCVRQTLAALRNNEIVFIPLDQNFGTSGIFVDFFGRKAATAVGPVVFAQRADSVILPCFVIRDENDRHQIIFEPPLLLEAGNNSKETILINIQKLTGIIESYIRKYPAQWGWIHRRWKSKPS